MYDPYKGRQSEVEDFMETLVETEVRRDPDAFDALELASEACSLFGLFENDPHGSDSVNIPVDVLNYALTLLPES